MFFLLLIIKKSSFNVFLNDLLMFLKRYLFTNQVKLFKNHIKDF